MRLVLLAMLLISCGGGTRAAEPPASPPPPVTPPAEPPPEAPGLRLPRTVLPTGYEARLALDPAQATFSGEIAIRATVAEPTRLVWLHAEHLTIEEATATAGGETVTLEVLPQESVTALRAGAPLPAGEVTISIRYQGKVDDHETDGIFRQQEGQDWYAFTQFQAIMARRAFPCFDEPDNKVPWQLTLEVPESLLAVANTPVASETPTGRGTKVVVFQPTRPLPSYLIAFAVGPFETVDAGKVKSGAAFRVIVPRGRGGHVGFVVETTPPILELLEAYFDMPYPFEKLDLLAVPLTASFGAMENPGLVTFNQGLLVARPEDFTIAFRRRYATITAHELAHQWFGDLVTLAWWDDIWLNESFAEWMADRTIARWKPEWGGDMSAVSSKSAIMSQDSLQSARRLRQPVASVDDIHNSVDQITYSKGSAVLSMFEQWIGEERFRDGVRAYLRKHAWKNATAPDFFAAITEAAGQDVATPLASFVDQVGTPLVTFELACGKGQPPRLLLAQERYVPTGSQASADQTWQLPLCVGLGTGRKIERRCTLLTEQTASWAPEGLAACPAFVLPNLGGTGYYRSALKGDLLPRLLGAMDRLPLPDRLGVIGDVDALVAAGKVEVGTALAFVPRYAAHQDRNLVGATAGITARLRETIPPELRPNYARFVRKMFGARARALGWKPKAGEDDDTRLLRRTIVPLVGRDGEDGVLAAQARALALAWLEDHAAIDPDMVGPVLGVAAHHGDSALFERFYRAAREAGERSDRLMLLGALAGFRPPALVERTIALSISGEFDTREAIGLFFGGLQNPATRPLVYEAVKRNYDVLIEKMPRPFTPYLVFSGVAQCDAKVKPEVETFFKERTARTPGGQGIYQRAMESMDVCIQQRQAQRPGMTAFLRRY
jgi:cytosol alanyl aminopeptidase